jgi:hypothetical protein
VETCILALTATHIIAAKLTIAIIIMKGVTSIAGSGVSDPADEAANTASFNFPVGITQIPAVIFSYQITFILFS